MTNKATAKHPDQPLEFEGAIPAHFSTESRHVINAFLQATVSATAYTLLAIAARMRSSLELRPVTIPQLIAEDHGEPDWDRSAGAKTLVLRCCESVLWECRKTKVTADVTDSAFVRLVSVEVSKLTSEQIFNLPTMNAGPIDFGPL